MDSPPYAWDESENNHENKSRPVAEQKRKCLYFYRIGGFEEGLMRIPECCFLVFLILCPGRGQGAVQEAPVPDAAAARRPAAPEIRFTSVQAELKDGRRLVGTLVGWEGQSVVLRAGNKDIIVAAADLRRIEFARTRNSLTRLIKAISLGLAIGHLTKYAKGQPVLFEKDLHWSVLSAALSNIGYAIVPGCAIYYLSGLFEPTAIRFEFEKPDGERSAERASLERFILQGPPRSSGSWHIRIKASHIFPRVSERYESLMRDAGCDFFYSAAPWGEKFVDPATRFNLLRGVRLTRSLKSGLEVGVAAAFLGEPQRTGTGYSSTRDIDVTQRLSIAGLYAVAAIHPLAARLPSSLNWTLGAGLGWAWIDFGLKSIIQHLSPDDYESKMDRSFSTSAWSVLVFTGLEFRVSDDFSLCLEADYGYIPPRPIPELAEAGIPAQKLSLGNASIGVTLGWHF
jgi:hypothetical protein